VSDNADYGYLVGMGVSGPADTPTRQPASESTGDPTPDAVAVAGGRFSVILQPLASIEVNPDWAVRGWSGPHPWKSKF
jgi:hypothetical protein